MNLRNPGKSPRLSGGVMRYSSWPTIQQQTVADHTWQKLRIYHGIWGAPDAAMFEHILFHDGAEVSVGDIPFPCKAENPDLKEVHGKLESKMLEEIHGYTDLMTEAEAWKLKVCDLIEMWEFGIVERVLGNKLGEPIELRTHNAVDILLENPPKGIDTQDVTKVKEYMMRAIQ